MIRQQKDEEGHTYTRFDSRIKGFLKELEIIGPLSIIFFATFVRVLAGDQSEWSRFNTCGSGVGLIDAEFELFIRTGTDTERETDAERGTDAEKEIEAERGINTDREIGVELGLGASDATGLGPLIF